MLFLYTLLLSILGLVRFLIGRRVANLEARHARLARLADDLLHQPPARDGSGRIDAAVAAKRQYLLGLLVQKRDRLEDRYAAWQVSAEKYGRWLAAVRGWRGKALPYTLGVVDVVMLATLADYLGAGEYVSGRYFVQLLTSLFTTG